MQVFSEFFILFITVITTGFSTIFCLIGFLTPGWNFDKYRNLFCDQCPKIPNTLAVMSIMLLIICFILLTLLIAGIIDQQRMIVMRFIIPSLLLLSTIFLLATLTSYLHFVQPNRGYSYNLVIVAFIFAYLASLLAAFWLGNGGFISKSYPVELIVENR
jgi:hypothetical protein